MNLLNQVNSCINFVKCIRLYNNSIINRSLLDLTIRINIIIASCNNGNRFNSFTESEV